MRIPLLVALLLSLLAGAAHAQAPLVITTTTCPAITIAVPYQCQFQATGGTPPYHWSAVGAVPYGFTFSDSGVLSGTLFYCTALGQTNCYYPDPNAPGVLTIQINGQAVKIPVNEDKPKKKPKKEKTT